MQGLINIAIKAAREAGDFIIKAAQRLDLITTSKKDPYDYVTDIDNKAERIIIRIIHEHFPDHGIHAEESGSQQDEHDISWIIDPLDGTKNFIHGIPHYAVSIGIKHKQQLIAAVIYDPSKQELFTAERGRGAKLNDKRIRVSNLNTLDNSLIATALPFKERQKLPHQLAVISQVYSHIADIRRAGSAALDLAYVACGRLDGYFEIGLAPWDMAAGILLVRESGGIIVDYRGGENYFSSGEIVTANPRLVKHLIRIIASVKNENH